jgi:hypothetical protein
VYRTLEENAMKYLILIYSNPASRQVWESLSDEDHAVGYAAYAALDADLAASAELIVSEALADVSYTKRVSLLDGVVSSTDGPFAETKEHLVGFYLVDCDSEQRALDIAGRVPEADLGLVEVRPIMDLSGADM